MSIFSNIKLSKDKVELEYSDSYPGFINAIRRTMIHGDNVYVLDLKSMLESNNHPKFEETKLIFQHIYINNLALSGDPSIIEFSIEYDNTTTDKYHKLYSRDIVFKPSKGSQNYIRQDIYICTVSPGQKYEASGVLSKTTMPLVSNCSYNVDKNMLEKEYKYTGRMIIYPLEIYPIRTILIQCLHNINTMISENFSPRDEIIESNLTVLELVTQHINRTKKSDIATYTVIHPLKSSYRFQYKGNIDEIKKELLYKIKETFNYISKFDNSSLDNIYYY
jgi:hypothetical protein